MRRVVVVLLVAALVVPAGAGLALADVRGSPSLSVTLTDDTVAPGGDTQLRFTLSNAGRIDEGGSPQSESRVTTARDVRVTVKNGSAPLSVETGTVALGSVPDGAAVPAPVLVHVDENAEPGTYEVRVEVEYTYTARIEPTDGGTEQTTETVERTFEVDVHVEEAPRFEVVSVRSSAAVGEPGTVTLTVRNEGDAAASAATLTARSADAGLTFGGAPSATAALGDVAPGENRTVAFRASVAPSATAREFALETTVAYENADGVPGRDTDTARVAVGAEQTFAVARARTEAGVGGQGQLTLAVRNTAGRAIEDASLSIRSSNAALTFGGTPTAEVFVGDWAAGETRRLTLTASVAPGATRRSYALSVTPSYTNAAGEAVRGEPLSTGVVPAPEQSFEVVFRRGQVPVGGSGNVTLAVRNTGRAVEDASLSIRSSNAALTFGGTPTAEVFVGDWAAGETRRVTVAATVAPGAARRSYALSVTPSYTDAAGEPARGEVLSTGVTPAPEQTFAVVERAAHVAVGGSGNVTLAVRNTGRAVKDASLSIRSSNAALTFGGTPTAETFVGDWAPGETRRVTVTASVAPGAERRRYAIGATVSYTTAGGREGRATLSTGVTPRPERTFSVVDGSVDVRVGAEGNLTGTVVNDGPGRVENAVLVLDSPGRTIDVGESEVAVGDLAAGERAGFSFELDVGETAAAGPRQFTLRLRYDDADSGATRRSDPLYVRGTVGRARDPFAVSAVEGTFAPGQSGQLVLRVTNTGDRAVRDVSAKLFADDPLSTGDDEAYVQRLAPGESTTITFGLSVGGGALAKAYPVSVDFQYDEPDGDTKLSDTYRAPVTVEPREGGGGLFAALPVVPVPSVSAPSLPPLSVSAPAGGAAGLLAASATGVGFAGGLAVGAVVLLVVALAAVRLRGRRR